MRWPLSLLFRGDRDAPAAADNPAAGGRGAPGAALGSAGATGAPARPAAWRGLPPLQRVAGDLPLTAPALPFGRDLAGRRQPDPILRPLAHDYAADGPAGLVSGIATPLAVRPAPAVASADHATLPAPRGAARRVQRRARTVSGAALPTGEVAPAEDGPLPAVTSAGNGSADLHALPPPRSLPVVSPSAAMPALAATRVGASTAPEAARAVAPASGAAAPAGVPVQRSTASPTVHDVAPPAAPPAAPPVATPLAAAVAASASARAAAEAVGPPTDAGAPGERPAPPRSLGESRRLGLGAPIAGRPSIQRVAAGPDLPLARAGRTAIPPVTPAAAPAPSRRAAAADAALPVLRVTPASGRAAMPPTPGSAGPAAGAATAPSATPIAAGTGEDRAGQPTSSVQRSGERPLVGDAIARTESPSTEDAGGEPVGDSPGRGLPLAGGLAAVGETEIHDDGAGLGRAPVEDSGATPQPAAALSAAPAPTEPISADRGGSVLPAPTVPAERSLSLGVARSLRGAAPMRPGAGAPPAPPPAAPSTAAQPPAGPPLRAVSASAARGSGDAAGTSAASPPPGTPIPGGTASGWPVAQRSRAEEAGSARGPAARAAGDWLPLARPAATGAPPGQIAGPAPEPVAVSRLADGGGSTPPPARAMGWSPGSGFAEMSASGPAVVQRSVVIEEMETRAESTPASGGAGGGTGGAGPGGAGQDYEEIAEHVYDRIRSRFATELLLDRERMGLLIDG